MYDQDKDPERWAIWCILAMAGEADYTICEDGGYAKTPADLDKAIEACKILMVKVDPKIIDEVAAQFRRHNSN